MQIHPFKAVVPDVSKVPATSEFFDTVKFNYAEYARTQLFKKTDSTALYVYRISSSIQNFLYTGIIACADINDYINNNIKKHEKTIISNEQIHIELLKHRAASIKPVLLAYPNVKEIDDFLKNIIDNSSPFYTMPIDLGVELHTFWKIDAPKDVQFITNLFQTKVPSTYIADGHHRTASIAMLHDRNLQSGIKSSDKLLCAFFTFKELKINEFNRVVVGQNGLTKAGLMAEISAVCNITRLDSPDKPKQKFEFNMYLGKYWYRLKWRQEVLDGFAENLILLDVHILNEKILKPILGITNVRSDQRLKYVEGPKGLEGLTSICKKKCVGFYMYPVVFEDLKHIADDDGTMPPKSTFIEPRMKNGLMILEH
jgi:uncharacterized protein (DUF1015 family)